MKTTIAPKAINSSSKGVTMLMEANQEHGTTFVPRLLKWDKILSNNDWKFESIIEPLPIKPYRSSLEILKFFYESTQGSPSPSDMRPSFHRKKDSVSVIKSTENFTPDKKKISKWWNKPKDALKKAWCVDTYTKDERISLRYKWFKDMKRFKTEIEFFKSCTSHIGNKHSSSKNGFNFETSPILKIHEFSPESFYKPFNEFNNYPELLERINDHLSKLKITQGGKISALKDWIHYSKNFYPRPSFPDVQFEENHMHPHGIAYCTGITEWNIDGIEDGHIYNKLQEMGMNVIAYKWKNSTDKQAANRYVLTKVNIKEDCNNDYRKEHFLSGLAHHIAEKTKKTQFLSILDEEDSESESSSDSETEDEEFLNVAQNIDDSSPQCNYQGDFCLCDNQSIRVISDDSAEILFATIEHIKDDDARRSYLLELQKLVSNRKEKEVTTSVIPFSMKHIMNRFDNKKEEPSIDELRSQVNLHKQEIREVKSTIHKKEIDALTKEILRDAEGTSEGKEPTHSNNEENNSEESSSPGDESETVAQIEIELLKV
ncbi:hypothetical protein EJD97_000369 [Solanum chilense]|uniref:Uncharacterized protein n=1 Tax=Solanum chilense TaxID=4083 RepID=A0A6N2AQB1_SOLCI|nr:hypothetical protein EJD97_000369 [Solanum chilense]